MIVFILIVTGVTLILSAAGSWLAIACARRRLAREYTARIAAVNAGTRAIRAAFHTGDPHV